jgi:NIPSNAP
MTRVVEIRSYRLKPGTQDEYDRLFREAALPLLQRAGVDVVRAGRSLDDPNGYHLIRSFADLGDRERREAAFYGSDAWRKGPREAVLACIEAYVDAVIELDDAAVDALRAPLGASSAVRMHALMPAPQRVQRGAPAGFDADPAPDEERGG